ncbi:Gfo/Idh/MocA family protein [Desertihabitans aurantiacus]|uniref:Gfo/Idh/MocA family protein n=1 Tax=Desertihabitans aurantiacus TaxID=2282477 RepID=UPI000DF79DA4|nr:Gfo/Idh/MocA family oxidoreductase [Desertihabitans aurantiacus]
MNDGPLRFVVVGPGFRAGAFLRAAAALPELSCVGVVVRRPRDLGLPTFSSLADCLEQTRPDLVLTAVPWSVTPQLVTEAVRHGVPVLAETPPAPDVEAMRALWDEVGGSGLVQVAEQYLLLPAHAARLAVVRSGAIGTPTQVQISSTQYYHAVSLVRGLLGAGRVPLTVRADRFVAALVHPLGRQGWTGDPEPRPTANVVATLDLGDGRSGVYDFVDGQTRNPLRHRRTLVRGTHGELAEDEVARVTAVDTVTTSRLERRQTGHDLDLHGYDTDTITFDGEVVYRNPFFGRRWNDDEIATAALLLRTRDWVRGEGPEPYPLADGCYDHHVGLAIDAAASSGERVRVEGEPWVDGRTGLLDSSGAGVVESGPAPLAPDEMEELP